MTLADRRPQPADRWQLDQLVDVEQAGAESVVDVVIVIGDVVGDRRDLRFAAGPRAEGEVPLRIGLGHRPGRRGNWAIVLGKTLQRRPSEVQAVETWVRRFEPG